MPITYSFTTTIAMPTSANWPCMDFGESTMPNIFLQSEVTASRGAPWIGIDGNNDMVLLSDDGTATVVTIDLPIGQKFTFETTFKGSQLPTNMQDLNTSHFFVAVFDAQDNAGGVLLAQTGLAIVSSYGNTVMPIAGSQNIISDPTKYYTMRMVVDGVNNVMDLYITETDQLSVTGHQLQYTTAAPITPLGTPDYVRLELLGHPTTPVEGKFSTLRCNCTELVIPNLRPIADTGQDQTAVLGAVIALDGRNSYDPEGEDLTYEWAVYATPDGSAYRQVGTGGFTVDDLDGDGYTTIFEETGEPWSVTNSPSLQPGDVLIVDDEQYVVDDADWDYDPVTKTYSRGGTWDDNKLRVKTDRLPINMSGKGWDLYFQSPFFNDRTSPQPSFIPDIEGMYALQLVVNDGQLDSLPNQGLVNIAASNVAFGYVPDVNFIWDYLSDAWALYDDRDPVTTIWSGFAQVASNLLLTAWQLDYAKSLVDIQRTFQRRWLDYRPFLEESVLEKDDIELKIVRGKIVSDDITGGFTFPSTETLLISRDGGDQVTVSLGGTMTAQQIVDAVNEAFGESVAVTKTASLETDTGKDYLVLDYPTLLVVHKEGTSNSRFGFSTEDDTENSYSGKNGSIGSITTAFEVDTADLFIDLDDADITRKDLLVFEDVAYEIQKVAAGRQLSTLQEMDDMYSASHDRDGFWELSSFVQAVNTNFTNELVSYGDVLILEVRESGSEDATEVLCKVTGARNERVGFNPRPLLELVGKDLDDYEISLAGVHRVNAIPVDELVAKIPRLQEVILDPDTFLTENRDYTIYTDSNEVRGIFFKSGVFSFENPPPDILWAEVTYLDNKPMIEDNFGKPVKFSVENLETRSDDLDYLSAVRGLWYAFFNGPSLWNVRIGTQILLGLPFAEVDGKITDINRTYSASEIRVLITDSADSSVVRSYFIPRNANFEEDGLEMIEDNPDTGTTYAVGDTIDQFAPLCKGVEIEDWISDPRWWRGYNGQGVFLEVDKFFRFLARADIDVFNIANLVFAIDFVKAIKPHYTYPMWVIFKRIPSDTISVTDDIRFHGIQYLFDHPACGELIESVGVGGAFRFDDTDESGNYNWAFDGVPNVPTASSGKHEFLYDKTRLCPEGHIYGIMSANFAGGYFPFDWLWAFDDGGGEDIVPLSGPLAMPPPRDGPYGPLVGIIEFDKPDYPAGWYTRGKEL